MAAVGLQAAKAKAAAAEQGIAIVRFAIVVFNSILYLGWIWPAGIPWLAYTIIVVANVYSVLVVLRPPQFRTALLAATWTAITDAVLIVLWLTSTGAAASPFWILWSISIVAIAFRFGPRATAWATGGYVVADTLLLAAWGALWPFAPLTAVRIIYIAFFGLLAMNMSSSNMDALRREEVLAQTSAQLAASESRLQAILQNAPSFIVLAGHDRRIRYLNRTVDGVRLEDAMGQDILMFVQGPDQEQVREAFEHVAQTGRPVAIESRAIGPNGEVSVYQAHMAAVQGGEEPQVLMLATDVTQQKEQEEAAAAAQQQSFQIERLEAQDTFRRQLLNAVAHELNTPLTPLRLQLDIMQRRDGDSKGTSMMRRNIDRLARLVGDLLEVARLDAGRLELRRDDVDVAALVQEAVQTFEAMAKARDIHLETDLDSEAVAHVDRARISQVLYNLLSNALKYSPDGGAVHVSCHAAEDHVEVAVADKGPGFTSAQLAELYQPFHTIHASPMGAESTGLGLYITKQIVDLHEGSIEAQSEGPGKGARFVVHLPREP